ncbi:MAG: cytochrome P450, partial [Variovorax sp.]
MAPTDPVKAVVHPDPYPYYATLRDGPPLAWNATLRLWVASRAEVIETLLQAHGALRVRPAAEPVPRAIVGQPAGEVFGHLVRMNEGAAHQAHRP